MALRDASIIFKKVFVGFWGTGNGEGLNADGYAIRRRESRINVARALATVSRLDLRSRPT